MSSISSLGNTSPFANNDIQEDDLQAIEHHNFIEIPFYQRKESIQAAMLVASFLPGVACELARHNITALTYSRYWLLTEYIAFIGGIFLGYSYLSTYKAYQDPKFRAEVHAEFSKTNSSLTLFIQDHGWKNIRNWGFFIPEDQEPICTKKEFATKFMQRQASNRIFSYWKNLVLTSQNTLNANYPCYVETRSDLEAAFEHHIFSEDQLTEMKTYFQENISNLRATFFLLNWEIMKTNEFDKLLKEEQIQWIEKNLPYFEDTLTIYENYSSFHLDFMKFTLPLLSNIHDHENAEKLVETFPKISTVWAVSFLVAMVFDAIFFIFITITTGQVSLNHPSLFLSSMIRSYESKCTDWLTEKLIEFNTNFPARDVD